jgi:hypothetical protein
MHRPTKKILCSFSLTVETPTPVEVYVRESPFFGSGPRFPLAEKDIWICSPPELFHGYTIPQVSLAFWELFPSPATKPKLADKCVNVFAPEPLLDTVYGP